MLDGLNDDCLEAIFRKLPLTDLVSIGETCKKFREIARLVFHLAFNDHIHVEPQMKDNFIAVFGRQIISLSLVHRKIWMDAKYTEDFLNRLQQNCLNVKTLSVNIDDADLLSSVFLDKKAGQLIKLCLDISTVSAVVNDELLIDFLVKCAKLQHLVIEFADKLNITRLLQLTFASLQYLELFVNTEEFSRTASTFTNFIQRHPNLLRLNFYAPMTVQHLSALPELKSLKVLTLHLTKMCTENIAPVLQNLPVQVLAYTTALNETYLSELFAIGCSLQLYIKPLVTPKLKFNQIVLQLRIHEDNLTHLISLDFVKGFYKKTITRRALASFVKFVENCPSLEHISVSDDVFVNDKIYLSLVKACKKNIKRVKTLFIYTRETSPEQNMISQHLLDIHSNTVYIIT